MDVKMRVTQSANAVHLNVSVRLPYDDLLAAWATLVNMTLGHLPGSTRRQG